MCDSIGRHVLPVNPQRESRLARRADMVYTAPIMVRHSLLQSQTATGYAPRVSTLVEYLGPALAALRDMRGLSQGVVEERAGLAKNTLSKYETGRRRPEIGTLDRILEAIGADLFDLGRAAARVGGRFIPEEPKVGTLRLTPEEYSQLDEEARITAMGLVGKHLRDLRGQVEEPGIGKAGND